MSKAFTAFTAAASVGSSDVLLISQRSASVTITATTISALASDNSFNDSGSGFITAGFAVGDRVNVAGFTGNAANNIYAGVITAVTAGKMTIGGTDGDVIVDDAAGESVTISKWETKRALVSDLPTGSLSSPYDVPLSFAGGPPDASQVIGRVIAARDIDFDADFDGSSGYVGTNPTASFVISVQDDGTEIGTITIATDGTFTFATSASTAKTVAAGSRIEFVAPSSADATAADIAATLKGSA